MLRLECAGRRVPAKHIASVEGPRPGADEALWRSALTRKQVRALVDAHGEGMERFGDLEEAQAFPRG